MIGNDNTVGISHRDTSAKQLQTEVYAMSDESSVNTNQEDFMDKPQKHDAINLEISPNQFPNEIAAHECGHMVALAAAGLVDEFTSVTIIPQNGVMGLTTRTGASLTELTGKLAEHSQRLASAASSADAETIATAKQEFNAFFATIPAVCLPHLCFFFGGGSCDRLFRRENAARNAIDLDIISRRVIPAMAILPLANDHLREVQDNIDKFLFSVFEKNMSLFKNIYDALVARRILDRANLDPDILRGMERCATSSNWEYGQLLDWFRQWHASQPRTF